MSVKVLLVVALLATAALAAPPLPHQLEGYTFDQYLADFGKHYSGSEYFRRRALFSRSLAEAKAHNAGSSSYVKGINHMSDWSREEFNAINAAKTRSMSNFVNRELQRSFKASGAPLPAQVDYRNAVPAVLTSVKDQGHCGSCWAHAAVESMETHLAISTGRLHVLSNQELTSCVPNPRNCGGTGGCYGSTADLAFEYVMKNGISEEWAYPYTSYYGETGVCKSAGIVAHASGYTKMKTNDQMDVLSALATAGPLSVNVDASHWSSYAGGIFDGCDYRKNITINHVVQLVGYGHDAGLKKDYWIIRNSWSPSWGENGFMRLLKTDDVECGFDNDMQSGTACEDEPASAKVCGICGVLYDASYPNMS